MEVWFASTNQGKIKELKDLLGESFSLKTINELSAYSAPPETGKTFEENARIKARTLKALKPNQWILADDSGLEVDGLNKMPGVFSARYAGDNARDIENCSKVLKMISLRSPTNRKACFKCCLVAFDPQGKEYVFTGELGGQIAKDMRGKNGFGYDPIFIPDGYEQTLAEMGLVEKNKISHRKLALNQFLSIIKN